MLPRARIYCKFAWFLVNRFGKKVNCDIGMQNEMADYMVLRKDEENSLAEDEENQWNKKKIQTVHVRWFVLFSWNDRKGVKDYF